MLTEIQSCQNHWVVVGRRNFADYNASMRIFLAIILLGLVALLVFGASPNWDVYKYGTPEDVQAEIDKLSIGGGLEAENKDGWTPLMVAAGFNSDAEAITVLVNAGADLHARTEGDVSSLMLASGNNHYPVVKKLLEHGAELEAKDSSGWTPLIYAVIFNNGEVVSELLTAGAEIETRDNDGWTPLMCAARLSHNGDTISILLKAGADPTVISKEGESVLDLAKKNVEYLGIQTIREIDDVLSFPK
jgi:ankyrin repeat protein